MPYILRDESIVELSPIKEAHGGQGTIQVRQLLGDIPGSTLPGFLEDFDSPTNFLHIVTLPPGSSIGLHPHVNNEEFYYVIKGNAMMIVDDEKFSMPQGSVCLIKKGSTHAYLNESNEDLVTMVVELEFSK